MKSSQSVEPTHLMGAEQRRRDYAMRVASTPANQVRLIYGN
ncbi:MAG: hypothetical protein ACK45Y_08470 [Betaproteobacteria bacterium]